MDQTEDPDVGDSGSDVITKPKRVLSDKQKEAFAKCIQARKQKYEARKDTKIEQEVTTKLKKLDEKVVKLKSKLPDKPKPEPEEEEPEPEVIVVRKKQQPKKKKIIVVEESDDNEDKQVIQRVKRKPQVLAPEVVAPQQPMVNNICFC